ncbi:MAG: hypothetical protein ABIR11_05175 [Candidatus Limnocylindrales bacterium]
MPFGFLKRNKPGRTASGTGAPGAGGTTNTGGGSASSGTGEGSRLHAGTVRGVPFTALTEDWRLRGRMQIAGRLSDALNKREAIAISDVHWGPPDGAGVLDPAPGLKSVDPYDLILVTAGEDSLPPLTETERAALKVHKVAYDVALEVPPFRVVGTVFLHPGSEPDRLLDRSSEMFVPIADAVARLGEVEVSDPEVEVILVNRFYLRGVEQVDKRTGAPHLKLPGAPMGGISWQDRTR